MLKSFLMVLLLFTLVVSQQPLLSTLTSEEQIWLQSTDSIVLGIDTKFKPLNFTTESGEIQGINIDIVRLIEDRIGKKIIFKGAPWPTIYPQAMDHSIDGIIGADITEKRKKRLLFTPPLTHYKMALVTKSNKAPIEKLAKSTKLRIAIKKRTSLHTYFQKNFPLVTIIPTLSEKDALLLVHSNQADAAAGFYPKLQVLAEENRELNLKINHQFTVDEIGRSRIAIRNSAPLLASILSKAINTLSHEEKQVVINHWLHKRVTPIYPQIPLTDNEQQWLENNSEITLGVDKFYTPLNFENRYGIMDGMNIDYIKAIEKKLGISFVLDKGHWADVLPRALSYENHGIINADKSSDEEGVLLFTNSFIHHPLGIFTKRNHKAIHSPQALNSLRVAVKSKTSTIGYVRKAYPGATVIPTKSNKEALLLVMQGEADAAIDFYSVLNSIMEKNFFSELSPNHVFFAPNIGMARIGIRKDAPELHSAINKAIEAISPAEKQQIVQNWISDKAVYKQLDEHLNLTEEQLRWLEQHPVITVGMLDNHRPISYRDGDSYNGLVYDYLRKIDDKLPITFQYTPLIDDSATIVPNIDLISTVTKSNRYRDQYLFSDSYLTLSVNIFALEKHPYVGDVKAFYGKKVAVMGGFAIEEWIQAKHPEIEILRITNTTEGLTALKKGTVQAMLGNPYIISDAIMKHHMRNIHIVGKVDFEYHLAMAVTPENEPLISIINDALHTISKDERQIMFNEHMNFVSKKAPRTKLYITLAVISLVILTVLSYWNRRLSDEINHRNAIEQTLHKTIAKLSESERKFKIFFESLDDAIFIHDLKGNFLDVNRVALNRLGYTADEILNMSIADIDEPIPGFDPAKAIQTIVKKKSMLFESIHRSKAGKQIPVEISSHLITFNNEPAIVSLARDISDRKEREREIKESTEKLTLALQSSMAGIWRYDLVDGSLEWDDRMFELYGTSRENFSSAYEAWQSALYPEDKQASEELLKEAIEGRKEFNTTFRILWPSGEVRHIQAHAVVKRDEENNPLAMVGVNFDITKSMKQQKQLELSESRLQQAQTIGGFGYWDLDALEDQLVWSKETYSIFDTPKKRDFPTKEFLKMVHPDDRERVEREFRKSIQQRTKYYVTHRIIQDRSKSVRTVIEQAQHHYNLKGQHIRSLGTVHDITEQMHAEEEKNRFFNLTQDFVGLADFNGHFRLVSDAFLNIFQLKKSDIDKVLFFDLIHPDDHEITREKMGVLAQGETLSGFENRYVTPGGETKWFSWNATPDLENGIIYFVARDITDTKAIHKELIESRNKAEQALKAKSEFLANMSHEIRTPLNAVTGFAELLEGMVTDKEQRSYLSSIKVSSRTLLRLINDVLDLSKMEAGRLDIHYDFFQLKPLINDMQQMFSAKIKEKNLALNIFCPQSLHYIKLDEVRLRQILLNLLGNAIKFTSSGSITLTIDLETSNKKGSLTISVSDTGIGIPLADQENIFKDFQQKENQDIKKYGGTGLGLAISKRLIEMLGGTISVKSKEGEGATFTVYIPSIEWRKSSELIPGTHEFSSDNITFSPQEIWIVDDVESNRIVLEEQLKSLGLHCRTFADPSKLLEALTSDEPQMIISDIRMPEMSGVEMSTIITKEGSASCPIVALTATMQDEELSQANTVFADYLTKPLEVYKLIDVLKRFFPYEECESSTSKEDLVALKDPMKQYLRETFIPLLDKHKGALIIDDIKELGEILLREATALDESRVITFAQTILDAAEAFDVKTIRALPDMVHTLLEEE